MYSYASLAAEQHALKVYKKIFPTFNGDVTDRDASRIMNAFKTLAPRNRLLNRELDLQTEDEKLTFCWAELEIHHYINREVWAGGKVRYMLALQNVSIEADITQLGALTLNKMLLDGYSFEENIGEHFTIITPSLQHTRATSAKHCTCGAKQCNHLIAVNEILRNRKGCKGLYSIKY